MADETAKKASDSETVEFAKLYNHRWPSGAVTKYPQGYSGRVKAEVAKGAREKGALVEGTKGKTTTKS